jgi:hypothetical protein
MDDEQEQALEQAYREEAMYHKGWDDSREYYREAFQILVMDMGFMGEFKLTHEVVNDIFNEHPEDAAGILYQAALNRGQP